MSAELDKTTSILYAPNGEQATFPTRLLSDDEARTMRQYKKLLLRYGLREALFCNGCWNGDRADGCKAHVTDSQILIQCRCTVRFFQGQTF